MLVSTPPICGTVSARGFSVRRYCQDVSLAWVGVGGNRRGRSPAFWLQMYEYACHEGNRDVES